MISRARISCARRQTCAISKADAAAGNQGQHQSDPPSWPATAATRRGRRAAHSTCQSGFPVGRRPGTLPQYLVKGSNISPDPESGIGKWSADDFKRALTEGVRPSAVALAPQMPFVFYKVL